MAGAKDAETAGRAIKVYLMNRGKLTKGEGEKFFYHYKGEEAVRHLFRVAASLDSLIIGEPQILGQVKDAYRLATEMGATGILLNRALHFSFRAAKRVRTETGLAAHAVSVSYAAVELAKKIFGQLEKKTALLIGAGEMAELAARHLMKNGIQRIILVNRTFSRAQELAAAFNGTALPFSELPAAIMEADIIVTSTGATGYLITPEIVATSLKRRRNRLLLMVDIAVPRDIDPRVGKMENVYLFDMDDLQDIADENMKIRKGEAKKAEKIVEEETLRYMTWFKSLETVPTIIDLREKVETIMQEELDRVGAWLRKLPEEDREEVEILLRSVVKKILHDPITALKEVQMEEGAIGYIALLRKLFKLNKTCPPATGRKDGEPSDI